MDVGKVISQSEKSYQTEQNFLQRKALTLLKYKISQIKIEKWGVGLGMAKQLVNKVKGPLKTMTILKSPLILRKPYK